VPSLPSSSLLSSCSSLLSSDGEYEDLEAVPAVHSLHLPALAITVPAVHSLHLPALAITLPAVHSLQLPALAITMPRLLPTVGSGEDGCCSTDSEDPDPTDMDQLPRPLALPSYTVPWAALPAGSLFDSHLHLDLLSHRLGAGRASLQQLVARDPLVPWRAFGGCVANFVRPADWQAGLGPGLRAAAEEERVHLAVGGRPVHSDAHLPPSGGLPPALGGGLRLRLPRRARGGRQGARPPAGRHRGVRT
jgi:hypothetical protein